MKLRPYQSRLKHDVYNAWDAGYKNVLAVAPTGSGKTVLFSDAIKDHDGPCTAIAHRQELVSQISQALARDEVPHKIIGPKNVVRLVVNNHMDEFGKNYITPASPVAVAGIDTLIRRQGELSRWCKSVTKWVTDEAHHVLTANKWGKGVAMFPNAIGLGVTATPTRADGKGLGVHVDGVFETMVEGPHMRELINMGYLTDYRIFAPRTEDLDLANVAIGNNGDFNNRQMVVAVRRSHIIGDIVKHYLRIAPGKLGVTFVPDVQTAKDTAAQFNAQGVPAAVVHAKTPDAERISILRQFKNREILQLVNVDLFGEGFDLPAIEVVQMARPTKSYSLYCQQFGRALRLMLSPILMSAWGTYTDAQRLRFIAESIKPHAIIIDHVGNIEESGGGHGLPDKRRLWSLDRRERNVRVATLDDEIPVRACPECTAVYERTFNACPFCGYKPELTERSGPEFVDGDLAELDPYTLAVMRGEVDHVDKDIETIRAECNAKYMPRVGVLTQVKRHAERQEIQESLRASIAWWAGYHRSLGRPDNEIYRRFYFKFKFDILSAQALNKKDALLLADKVNKNLGEVYQ